MSATTGLRTTAMVMVCALLAACGSSSPGGGGGMAPAFPSPEEVRELAEQPAPEVEFQETVESMYVEQWTLAEPLPTQLGTVEHRPQTRWGRDVAERVAQLENGRTSRALHCAARQFGHFYAQQGAMPSSAVERFLAARCGWVGGEPSWTIQHAEAMSADEMWNRVGDRFLGSISTGGESTPVDVGTWVGEIEGQTYAVLAKGRAAVSVESRSLRASDSFVVEGRVRDPRFGAISALVTEGDFGYAHCESDEGVRFPQFRFRCPLAEGDEMAWFEFLLEIEGEKWRHSGYAGLIWAGEADNAYRAAPWRRAWAEARARRQLASREGAEEVSQPGGELSPKPLLEGRDVEGDTLEQRIVAYTNIARDLAERPPVSLDAEQTQTNTALAPHFFRAQQRRDWEALDRYAASMLAGWDIDEPVLSANLTARAVAGDDGRRIVDALLELPAGRDILMGEQVSTVALGTLRRNARTWSVVAGYRRVPDLSGEEMVTTAVETINAAREDAGVGPLGDSEEYQDAAVLFSEGVARRQGTPQEAARQIMEAMRDNMNTAVRSWTIFTDDLERIHLPDEIVTTPGLRAAVIAAPWRAENEAWTLYRVVVIFPQSDLEAPTELVMSPDRRELAGTVALGTYFPRANPQALVEQTGYAGGLPTPEVASESLPQEGQTERR